MQTRSKNLAPNGRSGSKKEGCTNNTEVTSEMELARIQEDMKRKLYEQTEIEIPKLKKYMLKKL